MRHIKAIFYFLITTSVIVIMWILSRRLSLKEYSYKGIDHKIHIVNLRYSGQQAAGINAITSLQCWAGHSGIQMSIVEPFIGRSSIVGSLKRNKKMMKLSDYFDYEHLNKASREVGLAEFTRLDQFIAEGSKNVIYIFTYSQHKKLLQSNGSCLSNRVYSVPRKSGYCVVGIVHTNDIKTTLQEDNFRDILGQWHDKGVTIVFTLWKGPSFIQRECKGVGLAVKSQFHPSARLLRDAEHYKDVYMDPGDSIAIMIRVEHVLRLTRTHFSKDTILKCFQRLAGVFNELQRGGNRIPMIAADIGKYGSKSWNWGVYKKQEVIEVQNQSRTMMKNLLGHDISFKNWEDSFVDAAGGVHNEGYIAALQRTIASRAECLVLMGGGNFQQMALEDYLRYHTDKRKLCVHLICVNGGTLNNILNSAKKK